MARDMSIKQEPHRLKGDPKIIPPQSHVQHAGHHWVERIDFDGRASGKVVLQWQPVGRTWCLPNQYANGSVFDVEDYVYLGPCQMPLFEHERTELRAMIRTLDDEAKRARKAKGNMELTDAQWETIRDLIYPMS